EPLDVVLLRQPASLLHQIALHVAGKRDRPTEAQGTEPQEVQDEVSERAGLERVRWREGAVRGLRWIRLANSCGRHQKCSARKSSKYAIELALVSTPQRPSPRRFGIARGAEGGHSTSRAQC